MPSKEVTPIPSGMLENLAVRMAKVEELLGVVSFKFLIVICNC
jgi:hypothetical protein